MKNANHPRVSFLLITYNQDEYIRDALRSVLNQNRLDFEFVVCDDGSTDQTVTIIEDELSHWDGSIPVKKHYSRVNVGLIANFNQGMAMCKGEYIIVMPGDDISLPRRVDACVKAFDADPDCMLVLSSWECISDAGMHVEGGRLLANSCYSYASDEVERSVYAGAPICIFLINIDYLSSAYSIHILYHENSCYRRRGFYRQQFGSYANKRNRTYHSQP